MLTLTQLDPNGGGFSTLLLSATFHGHKTPISALAFNPTGEYLVSGELNGDLVVWDCFSRSGSFRLTGHDNQITSLLFLVSPKGELAIISASKDTSVRLWDFGTQICTQTLIDSNSDVWSVAASPSGLVVAGNGEGKVWMYRWDDGVKLRSIGELGREGKQKVDSMIFALVDKQEILVVGSHKSRFLDVYGVIEGVELEKRKKRKLKKSKKFISRKMRKFESIIKSKKEFQDIMIKRGVTEEVDPFISTVYENLKEKKKDLNNQCKEEVQISPLTFMKKLGLSKRFASFSLSPTNSLLVCGLRCSSVEAHDLSYLLNEAVTLRNKLVSHSQPICHLDVAGADEALLSVSASEIKVWTTSTFSPTATFEVPNATAGFFVAGGRHIVLSTGDGKVLLYGLDSCDCLCYINAHEGASIIALVEMADHTGFYTAGSDKTLKKFLFNEVDGLLTFSEDLVFPLTDPPTSLAVSHGNEWVLVGGLDNVIRMFYTDSGKMFLSFYGHSLPCKSISVSSDDAMLASGSVDKTVKIWDLKFGNVLVSLKEHQAAISALKWIPETHYLLTASRDGSLILWDIDKQLLVANFRAHQTPITALAISLDAHFIVTAAEPGSSMRVWRRTDEQLFIEEEREAELLESFEKDAIREDLRNMGCVNPVVMNRPSRRTLPAIRTTEKLMEMMDDAWDQLSKMEAHEKNIREGLASTAPEPKIELMGASPQLFILNGLMRITPSLLHEVLIGLPFLYAHRILQMIKTYLEAAAKGSNGAAPIELLTRIIMLLTQLHFRQLTAAVHIHPLLVDLRSLVQPLLRSQKIMAETNAAAVGFWKDELTESAA